MPNPLGTYVYEINSYDPEGEHHLTPERVTALRESKGVGRKYSTWEDVFNEKHELLAVGELRRIRKQLAKLNENPCDLALERHRRYLNEPFGFSSYKAYLNHMKAIAKHADAFVAGHTCKHAARARKALVPMCPERDRRMWEHNYRVRSAIQRKTQRLAKQGISKLSELDNIGKKTEAALLTCGCTQD